MPSESAIQKVLQAMMPKQPRFSDFRREDIEDRRKEHFLSNPQAPQMPNVFGDPTFGYGAGMTNLSWQSDFLPIQPSQLADDAGAGNLDALIQQYLAARQ